MRLPHVFRFFVVAAFLSVIRCGEGAHCERTARIATRKGARTSFFSSDLLFLAVPKRAGSECHRSLPL